MNLRLLALLASMCPILLMPNISDQAAQGAQLQQVAAAQLVCETAVIMPFDDARDMDELVKIFDADRQWFTGSSTYSIAEAIRKEIQKAGCADDKLYVTVLRECDTLVGFIIYRAGHVNYLGVSKDHRGKRYGEKLLGHAIEEMKKMGMRKVRLGMYIGNEPAQKLYHRFGFCETGRSHSVAYFEYKINTRAVGLYDVYPREA
jgi:GNAT superfamily N-acetyltransferase